MGAPTFALAVSLMLSAQAEEPQLVVLPLEAEGVKAQLGLDAWKTVVAEVAKAKAKLKVGVALQKELHDMLLGPAREQARDCGANLDCLRDIGRALDVSQLIAGKVTKDEVSLVALDVLGGQKLGSAKSPANMAKAKVEQKSRAAAQALISAIVKGKKGEKPVVAEAAKEPPRAQEKEPEKELGEPAPAEVAQGGDDLKEDPAASPAPAPGMNDGQIHVAKEQLAGIAEITVDGTPVSPGADGSITWVGSSGSHTLAFRRGDGSRETREVVVDPGRTAEVSIPPPSIQPTASNAATNATSVDTPRAREEDSVTGKWWFWTAVATAVLAGGATTVVLAGGLKGGPSVPSGEGAISGTY
jgi:hypothetical protein